MKYLPPVLLALVPVLVMLPFAGPGYLFLLDMMWAPPGDWASQTQNSSNSGFPLQVFLWSIGNVIAPDVLQKMLLLAILLLMAFSMYLLARSRMPRWWAALAGAIYLLNPYVYERLLAGHFLVLLGYAFFPLAVLTLLRLAKQPKAQQISLLILTVTVFPLLSLHWAYIGGWFLLLLGCVQLFVTKSWQPFLTARKTWLALSGGLIVFLVVNAFWLLPQSDVQEQIERIDGAHFTAFQTVPDPERGMLLQVLNLYGFWQNEHLLPKDFNDQWWMAGIAFLILAAAGGYVRSRKRDPLAISVLIAFFPALLIAIGYGSSITRPLIDLLMQLPGFAGLRETHKAAGLLAFAYALLAPLGALALGRLMEQTLPSIRPFARLSLGTLLAALVYATVSPIFSGFGGQLKTSDYPASWYEARAIVKRDAEKVLFLPWHGYMPLPFTQHRTVANPAARFFPVAVVQGRGFRNSSIDGYDDPTWDNHIFSLLNHPQPQPEDLEFLRQQEISHIVLAKVRDWERYFFLAAAPEVFTPVYDSPEIAVYRFGGEE